MQIDLISVVIPAKNEEKRLPSFLDELLDFCKASQYIYEVIVIDDGSVDGTYRTCLPFQKKFQNFKVIRHETNHGKGYAVRKGLEVAKGDIVLFLDADGATPAFEIEKNLHYFLEGYDIVIGSRELFGKDAERRIRIYRRMIGRLFHVMIRFLTKVPSTDTQCGFKMFRKSKLDEVLPALSCDGFAFDIEIVFLALQKKFRVKEAPVSWRHVPGSHINFFIDPWKMLRDVLILTQPYLRRAVCEKNEHPVRSLIYIFAISSLIFFLSYPFKNIMNRVVDASCPVLNFNFIACPLITLSESGPVKVHFYAAVFFIIFISLLVMYFQKRLNFQKVLQVFFLAIGIMVALRVIFQIKFLKNDFRDFYGKQTAEKLQTYYGIFYDFPQKVREVLPENSKAKFVTDYEGEEDMQARMVLAYFLYPIDIKDIRKGPVNAYLIFNKDKALTHVPAGFEVIRQLDDRTLIAVKKDSP